MSIIRLCLLLIGLTVFGSGYGIVIDITVWQSPNGNSVVFFHDFHEEDILAQDFR